ncbi:uncharacterized protein LOC135394670 [Ornithodoros turicata]|uniref:uncharacterized protein LOC135394670 n=1 Tax=Ornithodoros turicata TaxID=34597 RepID=UPI003139C966
MGWRSLWTLRYWTNPHPDRGRSWLTALATAWLLCFTFALFRSYGVLYLYFTRSLAFSRQEATAGFTAVCIAVACSSLLTSCITHYVSVLLVSLLCSVFCGMAACIIYIEPTFLGVMTASIVYGLGLGGVENCSLMLLNRLFKKHRTAAVGIASAGVALGGIGFPLVFYHLNDVYTIRGACLVFGAIMLNGCVGVFFQRSLVGDFFPTQPKAAQRSNVPLDITLNDYHANTRPTHTVNGSVEKPPSGIPPQVIRDIEMQDMSREDLKTIDSDSEANDYTYHKLRSASNSNVYEADNSYRPQRIARRSLRVSEHDMDQDVPVWLGMPAMSEATVYEDCQSDFDPCELEGLPVFRRRRLLTEGSESYVSCYSSYPETPTDRPTLLEAPPYDVVETAETGEVTVHRRSVSSESIVIVRPERGLKYCFRSTLHLCTQGMFYVCTLSCFLLYYIGSVYASVALDFFVDKGVRLVDTMYLLPIYSSSDLLGRLVLGYIINSHAVSKKCVMIWTQASSGLIFLAAPYLIGYWVMIGTAVVFGINLACINVLYAVMFAEYMGLHHISLALGLCYAVIGVTALIMVPVIGHCRDVKGSYDPVLQGLGLLCLLNVFLWLFVEPFFSAKNRASTRRVSESNQN